MRQAEIIAQTDADIMPLYQYFGLRDWLEEPSLDDTSALVAFARNGVAACDGQQLIVSCGQSESPVRVTCQFWSRRPLPEESWRGYQEFHLACPSGEVFIDQPTMLAVDLSRCYKLKSGMVNVRVMWRGRRVLDRFDETSHAQDVGEIYNLQLWQP